MTLLWSTALARVRRGFLKDPLAKKWTDEVLLDFANLALDDLSAYLPRATSAPLVVLADTPYVFMLPEDLRSVEAVLWSDGASVPNAWDLARKQQAHNLVLPEEISAESELSYLLHWPSEGYLTVTRLPAGVVMLHYNAYRSHIVIPDPPPDEPPPDYEAPAAPTLPFGPFAWLEGALYCYMAMLCHLREGVTTAMLEQFKVRNDMNVGNPLNVEAREWWVQYQRIVNGNAPK